MPEKYAASSRHLHQSCDALNVPFNKEGPTESTQNCINQVIS